MKALCFAPRTSARQLAMVAAFTLVAAACHDDRTNPTITLPTAPGRAVTGAPSQQDWKQCENGKSAASACSWVTGNLDGSHNEYQEGQFVPHVLFIGNITNTDPFDVVMTFGFMKNGKTAHDFLGTWNRTMVNANPCLDGSFSGLCTSNSLGTLYTTTQDLRTLFRTQAKALCDATGDGYVDAALNAVTDNDVRIQGKNVSNITTAVTYDGCPVGTGSAEATVTFTVTPTAAAVTNGALLLIGSHIARGVDWPNGGAASIPGSPYHLGLVSVDGKAGSMDLQMQSAAVVIPGTLTIVKRVVNDNGGTATVTDFGITSSAGALTFGTGVADGTSTLKYTSNTMPLAPGTYTLHEDDIAGYTEGAWSCTGNTGSVTTLFSAGSVAVANGQTVVCTITNDDNAGTLQLVKRIVNDNGGTAVVGAFGLATTAGSPVFGAGVADGPSTLKYSSNLMPVNAGTYTLTENAVAGYTEGTWSCTGGTVTNSAFNAGSVTIPAAAAVVCTITNDDQQGTLQLRKRIVNDNGGTAVVAAFGLTTNAGALTFGAGVADGANTLLFSSNLVPVNAGTYSLSESAVSGYTAGTWSCTGGTLVTGTFNAGSVTVPAAGTTVCTITNDDQQGSLQLVKRVVNDNGGTSTVSAFGLATNAGSLTFGSGVPDGASTLAYSSNVIPVNAGTYSLTENDVAGYLEGTWSCSAGTMGSTTFNAGSVTVPFATAVVCTITNNDQQGTLQLRKRVVNDNGGTATVAAFGLGTDAGTPVFGAGVPDGANTLLYTATALPVNAGTYTLTESDVAGYTKGAWSCTGGTLVSGTFNAGSVTVPFNGTTVCTITNNDIAPSLTLDKVTSYSYGGTRPESDWTLAAAGTTPLSGAGAAGHTDVVSGATFSAGTYTLSETGTYAGYQNGSAYSCVKNGGAPVPGNSISLAVGDVAVCTITNTDLPGTITIVKNVAGQGGIFAFTSTGTGLDANFSIDVTSTPTAQRVFPGLGAGGYTVTESAAPGYTLTGLSCTAGGTGDYTVSRTATITLPLGGSVTCTFENTRNALVTRTQGFWATHMALTNAAWFGGSVGGNDFPGIASKTLCARELTTLGQVLGGFWSNIPKTSTGTKRSDLDQARMQLLQQLLAAKLNQAAFGSTPVTGMSIGAATDAYCGLDIALIKTAASNMAAFNEYGDMGLFTPGVSANGKQAKDAANLAFWNTLP